MPDAKTDSPEEFGLRRCGESKVMLGMGGGCSGPVAGAMPG